MENNPIISIIVPVYNVEEYLHYCIDSILAQSYNNIEVLLINDGSTDNSESICLSYANIDKRIHYIYQKNSGVSAARNLGLKQSKGEYIYFIDADDYIHPKTLEILFQNINKGNYDLSMILGRAIYDKNIKHIYIPTSIDKKILDQNYLMKGLFNLAEEEELQYQVVWNKLYKKEVLKDLFFIKTGTEDTEFNCRVYQKCNKAILIKLPLYYWIQRSTSITHQPINDNYINRMHSYYIALNNIPFEMVEYRSFCLDKLYKTMINIRYHAKNTPYKNSVQLEIQKLYKQTYNEFWHNNYIKLYRKIGLSIFFHISLSYTIFMKIMELKAKL